VVEVVEDGVGGADTERRSGLLGRADRVKALGGRLRIWTPRGGGTRVRAGAAMRVAAPVPAVVLLSWGHPVDWL
jgi:glucose-6-phosphate-specific signal transduction histidine kinase